MLDNTLVLIGGLAGLCLALIAFAYIVEIICNAFK